MMLAFTTELLVSAGNPFKHLFRCSHVRVSLCLSVYVCLSASVQIICDLQRGELVTLSTLPMIHQRFLQGVIITYFQ